MDFKDKVMNWLIKDGRSTISDALVALILADDVDFKKSTMDEKLRHVKQIVSAMWNAGLITVTGQGEYTLTDEWFSLAKARNTPASEEFDKRIKSIADTMQKYTEGKFSSPEDLWEAFWDDIDGLMGEYSEEEEAELDFIVRHKDDVLAELQKRFS